MYIVDKLYEVVSDGKVDAATGAVGIRFAGTGLSVIAYGSQKIPETVSEMSDLRLPDYSGVITSEGWHSWGSLPRYIAFVGTAPTIETTNISLKPISDIS